MSGQAVFAADKVQTRKGARFAANLQNHPGIARWFGDPALHPGQHIQRHGDRGAVGARLSFCWPSILAHGRGAGLAPGQTRRCFSPGGFVFNPGAQQRRGGEGDRLRRGYIGEGQLQSCAAHRRRGRQRTEIEKQDGAAAVLRISGPLQGDRIAPAVWFGWRRSVQGGIACAAVAIQTLLKNGGCPLGSRRYRWRRSKHLYESHEGGD